MDHGLLYRRFKSLARYATSTGVAMADPIVTHPVKGDMTIFEVLAFEFAAPIDDVRAAVKERFEIERSRYFFISKKRTGPQGLRSGRIKVWRIDINDPLLAGNRDAIDITYGPGYFVAPTYRHAELMGFTTPFKEFYRTGVQVAAIKLLPEWLKSEDDQLKVIDKGVLRQFRKDRTMHIAHTPVTYERHYLQHARLDEQADQAITVDVTGMEKAFCEYMDHVITGAYAGRMRDYIAVEDRVSERGMVDRDLDMWVRDRPFGFLEAAGG